MFEKEVVIDGKGHLLGRLSSVVAKEVLRGQKVVVVRCEQIVQSGSMYRNKLKYKEYLNKQRNPNPRRGGAFHFRAPSRMFWKAVRGMVPRKTARGEAALGRLKTFEGIPYPYDHKRRMVIPDALKVLHLRDFRKYTVLGELAAEMGWKQSKVVSKLEERRKEKSDKYWELKQKKITARKNAEKNKELAGVKKELEKYGF